MRPASFKKNSCQHLAIHLPRLLQNQTSQRLPTLLLVRNFSLVPRIFTPTFWRAAFPGTFATRNNAPYKRRRNRKPVYKPAIFFMWMALFIGSSSIQNISLQRKFYEDRRQIDEKIDQLKEVVKRLQNGEDVDIEAMLGTGDEVEERKWEEVIRALQEDDLVYAEHRKRQRGEVAAREETDTNHHDGQTKTWWQWVTGAKGTDV